MLSYFVGYLVDSFLTFLPAYVAAWDSGLLSQNFGKGSPLENYLETLFKV